MATFSGNPLSESIANILRNDFESIFAIFQDPDSAATNVSAPTLLITDHRSDPSDPGRTVVTANASSSSPVFNVVTGTYGYKLSPDELEAGYYRAEFRGTLVTGITGGAPGAPYDNVTLPKTLIVCGEFKITECTPEYEVVLRIRRRLKDVNVRLYRLDLPTQKWSDEEILDAYYKGINEINATPPMRTNFVLSTLPWGVIAWVEDLAFADLLESGGLLENWNTYTMGDGSANLNLSRASFLSQLANSVRTRTDAKIAKWKRSLVPKLAGQGTNQYPFQIRHVLSFMPNFKNIFGG